MVNDVIANVGAQKEEILRGAGASLIYREAANLAGPEVRKP
jgi:hypothetical protein